jgi:ssDNA-binding replication factor A large subunit
MEDLTLTAKVVQKSPTVIRNGKKYASAIVEDESGKIRLNLWREQVEQVNVGDIVKIPKAFVHTRGRTLQISTWSDMEIVGH